MGRHQMKGVRRGSGIRLPDPESLGLWPKRAVHLALVIADAAFYRETNATVLPLRWG